MGEVKMNNVIPLRQSDIDVSWDYGEDTGPSKEEFARTLLHLINRTWDEDAKALVAEDSSSFFIAINKKMKFRIIVEDIAKDTI
jgi:hypothetical protein